MSELACDENFTPEDIERGEIFSTRDVNANHVLQLTQNKEEIVFYFKMFYGNVIIDVDRSTLKDCISRTALKFYS